MESCPRRPSRSYKNRILNNGDVGIRLLSSSARLLKITSTTTGNMKFTTPGEGCPGEANDNWWGTKEGLKIIEKIYGRVDYQRVLDAPYPQGKPIELPILKSPLGGLFGRDSFLTLINSPYILEKDVVVDEGATLFIQPGVTLKFNPGTSLMVKNGGIDARGKPDRLITFTSNSSSPSPGSYPAAVRFEQPPKWRVSSDTVFSNSQRQAWKSPMVRRILIIASSPRTGRLELR